ncbi:MAG: guanylate kinase [Candidatus Saccharibacteria bacterium]|nr:guanylate kinase [Candidatus Saccharibacteria bacterium]
MDKQTFIQKAWELSARYTCSPEVKAHLAQLELIATVGATGAGKTTLMESSGIPYVLSDVTREPRRQEKDGVDYNFRTDYDKLWAELENGEFVQYYVSQTFEFYGTKATAYPKEGFCTLALIASLLNLFNNLGFHSIVPIYILPPNYTEWMRRAENNYDGEVKKRLIEAKESIELALSEPSYNFLVNDDLNMAIKEFQNIAYGKEKDPAYQERAREVAIDLLTKIEL